MMADRETLDLRVRMGRQSNGSIVLSVAEGQALVSLLEAIEYWHDTLDTPEGDTAAENLMEAAVTFYETQGGG